jgi:hypothetical protein
MLAFILLLASALTADEQAVARERIAKDTPELVHVATLTFAERTITVTGKASNPNAIANFVENVKNDKMLTMPVVKNVIKVGDAYEFEFTTELKPKSDECH